MNEALIIIPTYNERDNLPTLCDQVLAALPTADLLIVDDNSPDGTGQLADEMAKANPRIHVLHRSGKLGLGTAYIAGFRYALSKHYQYIFEMDADFSHDPVYLPALLAAAKDGAGVVIGSRRVPGGGTENWGLSRQLISAGGSLYARTILGLGVRDLTSGFKCFRREVLEAIDLDAVRSNGYSFQIEMTYRAVRKGYSVAEVPIIFIDRRAGQSKMSSKIFAEAMGMVWRLRFASGI
ncbi:MAG TPA: polyprenol monophosphomannose synthase [Pseudomonadota bacterium]|jgi:dolichol-phosphate mannosyltransferase|nr:polyprenol monophosphomannose synthase [Pseudomonadota bacterium]HNK45508.1 polyprenol monophosphomannose synthase [Pseudomonadota bacterium]HNN49499.1 polyprenol monophosphomannose synthase [Pseudomonadota bacterium]HNO67061.1 polyprenol monophosphomannose synthase [Pseudomonadota bacterium]